VNDDDVLDCRTVTRWVMQIRAGQEEPG